MQKYEADLKMMKSRNVIPDASLLVGNDITVEQNYEYVAKMFTAGDQQTLKAVPHFKFFDTEFVRTLFRILYRAEMEKLAKRTLQGTSKSDNLDITPQRLKVVNKMMIERMQVVTDDDERSARMNTKYIRKIISQGLRTIKYGSLINQ